MLRGQGELAMSGLTATRKGDLVEQSIDTYKLG